MRTRHRIPSLFTISMLDVFCCALGCVILLWLWNDRRAKAGAEAADRTRQELESTERDLASANSLVESLRGNLVASQRTVDSLTADRDSTRKDLTAARKDLAGRIADLNAVRAEAADLADRLARKTKEAQLSAAKVADLTKKNQEQDKAAAALAEMLAKKTKDEASLKTLSEQAQKRIAELEMLTREKEAALATAERRSKDLAERLNDAEGKLRLVRAKADTASSSLDEQTKKLIAAEARIKDLEKFLNNRKSVMIDMQSKLDELQSDRKSLSEQVAKFKAAADNRFAGIHLTGRRVVFLVDMSGSMKMVDENTPAPEKWTGLIATIEKVMKSLPDLEKFQIVMFSEGVTFPIGDPSEWNDFNPESSPAFVKQTLLKVEPKGNTNMYSAFESAFRFRSKGLDTIYLLSDGLPNAGPGLSPLDQTRNLSESEKGDKLGKYIRSMLKQSWNRPTIGLANVKINSIGFFYESPEVGAFLWALSRENDGSFVGMSKP